MFCGVPWGAEGPPCSTPPLDSFLHTPASAPRAGSHLSLYTQYSCENTQWFSMHACIYVCMYSIHVCIHIFMHACTVHYVYILLFIYLCFGFLSCILPNSHICEFPWRHRDALRCKTDVTRLKPRLPLNGQSIFQHLKRIWKAVLFDHVNRLGCALLAFAISLCVE